MPIDCFTAFHHIGEAKTSPSPIRSSRTPIGIAPGALRPILRAVEDAHDFNSLIRYLIDGDVRQGWKREFPSSGHAAAGSAQMGKVLQAGAAVIDGRSEEHTSELQS